MKPTIKTVTEQLYTQLRHDILSQEIPVGEKLTIKKLHAKYGVSSSPIREALTRLQQDGLIEYTPNVGMNVITLKQNDLREIFELMTEFDAIALRFAMNSPSENEFIKELEEIQQNSKTLLNEGIEWNKSSDDFHLLFYKYANNQRLTDASNKIRAQITFFSNEYEKSIENRKVIFQEHNEILTAIQKKDATLAEDSLRRHMSSSQKKAKPFKTLQNTIAYK